MCRTPGALLAKFADSHFKGGGTSIGSRIKAIYVNYDGSKTPSGKEPGPGARHWFTLCVPDLRRVSKKISNHACDRMVRNREVVQKRAGRKLRDKLSAIRKLPRRGSGFLLGNPLSDCYGISAALPVRDANRSLTLSFRGSLYGILSGAFPRHDLTTCSCRVCGSSPNRCREFRQPFPPFRVCRPTTVKVSSFEPHKLGSSALLLSRFLLLNRCPLSVLLRYERLYAFRQECVRIGNICVR